ncbi:MAG: hypothetical protein JWP87_6106 [Labilithrix sp.]|nr:hypothetical protein [Labilithrix sp.]
MKRWLFIAFASATAAAWGCVSTVDLGSHAPPLEGGSLLDVSLPSPGEGATERAKIFFVTDGRYTGDLAGLAGADAICMQEATAGGLTGVFKAWLSTSTEDAKDRIAPVGPWQMVDGRVVFSGATVGNPESFPTYSAKGNDLLFDPNPNVWTGTTGPGRLNDGSKTCSSWTSAGPTDTGTYGSLAWTSDLWTDERKLDATSETSPCSERLRLYCFEQ